MKVLVVEDEAEIASLICKHLEQNEYIVDLAVDLTTARQALANFNYSAVVLDRNLPDGDGLDLIRDPALPQNSRPPFLVLSALADAVDRVEGLEQGAIDYLVKPFEPAELLARLRISINSKSGLDDPVKIKDNLTYDLSKRTLTIDGAPITLRRRELAIFDVLYRNYGRVVSHDRIEESVYGFDDEIASNSIASHVSRLRKALLDHGAMASIKVIRGIGYLMEAEA